MERRPFGAEPAGLLLELEGVVVDTGSARRDALRDALGLVDLALPDDALASCADGHVAADAVARAFHLAASRGILARALDATDAELVAHQAERAFEKGVAGRMTLVPGAREAVAALGTRLRLGIVTRASPRVAHQMLAMAGLDTLIACVVTARPQPAAPSPDAYRQARARVALDRACDVGPVLAVSDDHLALASARTAGLATVLVGDGAADAAAVGRVATLRSLTYDAVVQFLLRS